MKTYEQIAQNVFRRREEYFTRQKQQRKRYRTLAVSLSCIALVVLVGIGIGQRDLLFQEPEHAEDAMYPGILDHFDDAEKGCHIVIQELETIPAYQMDIALLWEDFIPMTWLEIREYYGIDVRPTLPGDLYAPGDPVNATSMGIFRRDDGTGEVYFDSNTINFGQTAGRSVNLEFWKERGSCSCLGNFYTLPEKSVIGGVEMAIGQNKEGWFFAEFEHNGVGFRLMTTGLSQVETVAILSSLVD